MTLKDLLKPKREKAHAHCDDDAPGEPEFTFMRTDTHTEELLDVSNDGAPALQSSNSAEQGNSQQGGSTKRFSRLRSLSATSSTSATSATSERRLSQRLHLRHSSRSSGRSSVHVPADLPDIAALAVTGKEESQAEWEARATILARGSSNLPHSPTRSRATSTASNSNSNSKSAAAGSPGKVGAPALHPHPHTTRDTTARDRRISAPQADDDIQRAITLHESGSLAESTGMFARLAQVDGNAMAQIMYGLALRHGWGVPADPARGLAFLSDAAAGAASVEAAALGSGLKRGGAAKGELVLAIYELANSFRHGWGTAPDPLAARKYYEVAANLGDTDAMNEVAQCYESGYGGGKDRFTAAQYYRLAEKQGSKIVGNSWIWKDKYNPAAPVSSGQSH